MIKLRMFNLPTVDGAARARWLLPLSLALNVCFVGAAGAVAYHRAGEVPLAKVTSINRNAADRLGRLAAALPPDDAQIMRAQIGADAVKVATAQADLRLAREEVRNSLRAEPFDANALHAALQENHIALANFDAVLHDVIASAAANMSVEGRNRLADWPATHDRKRMAE
jgi:uncharacterized membrane protein